MQAQNHNVSTECLNKNKLMRFLKNVRSYREKQNKQYNKNIQFIGESLDQVDEKKDFFTQSFVENLLSSSQSQQEELKQETLDEEEGRPKMIIEEDVSIDIMGNTSTLQDNDITYQNASMVETMSRGQDAKFSKLAAKAQKKTTNKSQLDNALSNFTSCCFPSEPSKTKDKVLKVNKKALNNVQERNLVRINPVPEQLYNKYQQGADLANFKLPKASTMRNKINIQNFAQDPKAKIPTSVILACIAYKRALRDVHSVQKYVEFKDRKYLITHQKEPTKKNTRKEHSEQNKKNFLSANKDYPQLSNQKLHLMNTTHEFVVNNNQLNLQSTKPHITFGKTGENMSFSVAECEKIYKDMYKASCESDHATLKEILSNLHYIQLLFYKHAELLYTIWDVIILKCKKEMLALLPITRKNVNAQDNDQKNSTLALIWLNWDALQLRDNKDFIQKVINRSDLKLQNIDGYSVLSLMLMCDNPLISKEIALLLASKQRKGQIQDILKSPNDKALGPLHIAVFLKRLDVINKFYDSYGGGFPKLCQVSSSDMALTPMALAVGTGEIDILKLVCELDSVADGYGHNIMHYIAIFADVWSGRLDEIQELFINNPLIKSNRECQDGIAPVHLLLDCHTAEICLEYFPLLYDESNYYAVNQQKQNVLHRSIAMVKSKSEVDFIKLAESIIAKVDKILQLCDEENNTSLHYLIKSTWSTKKIAKLLKKAKLPSDILEAYRILNKSGSSAVHMLFQKAYSYTDEECLEILQKTLFHNDYTSTIQNSQKQNILHTCIEQKRWTCIKKFLIPNYPEMFLAVDSGYQNPLHQLATMTEDAHNVKPILELMMEQVAPPQDDQVYYLMDRNKAIDSLGFTYLKDAAKASNIGGFTPIDLAIQNHNHYVVEFLIREKIHSINHRNDHGQGLIEMAQWMKDIALVKFLQCYVEMQNPKLNTTDQQSQLANVDKVKKTKKKEKKLPASNVVKNQDDGQIKENAPKEFLASANEVPNLQIDFVYEEDADIEIENVHRRSTAVCDISDIYAAENNTNIKSEIAGSGGVKHYDEQNNLSQILAGIVGESGGTNQDDHKSDDDLLF